MQSEITNLSTATHDTSKKQPYAINAVQQIYRHAVLAREIDRYEEVSVKSGEAFFQVSGAGHEALAGLAQYLTSSDWLHCHYRDKALMLARGMKVQAFVDNLYCNANSQSNGRQMSAHCCDPTLKLASITGPVGDAALHAVGMAQVLKSSQAIVVCCAGDGTTQEGEYLEALLEAANTNAPVLFVVEDNQWAISTPTTGRTFFADQQENVFGIPIRYADGRNPVDALPAMQAAVESVRHLRKPIVLVVGVDRLCNHTNADDQTLYRHGAELKLQIDPLEELETYLLCEGVAHDWIADTKQQATDEVRKAAKCAKATPAPEPSFSTRHSGGIADFGESVDAVEGPKRLPGGQTMVEAMRTVLARRLEQDPDVFITGQDIEDPKGDVFGVTRGLSTRHPNRVVNAPLSESTIVGTCIGRALLGQRPVAMIQFADFLPLAYNQIVSELGSMDWRTNGQMRCPVIVMAPYGGYRPGLGPFHASSMEAVMAHTPGIDVCIPSDADDAARLLDAAFESDRPTIFLYPKRILHDKNRATTEKAHLAQKQNSVIRTGNDITLVGWGNTVEICEQVADALQSQISAAAEVINLRNIAPWDRNSVLNSVAKTGSLLVVHEDNHTCGFGAEVIASVAEGVSRPFKTRRVTRPDVPVPCNYQNQCEVLPSFRSVLDAAAELLDCEIKWSKMKNESATDSTTAEITAIGTAPSDEQITVLEVLVEEGDVVQPGQAVASIEASKSVSDLHASMGGTVEAILATEGDEVQIGTPLIRIALDTPHRQNQVQVQVFDQTNPTLTRRTANLRAGTLASPLPVQSRKQTKAEQITLAGVTSAAGGRWVENHDLLRELDGAAGRDVIRHTGIHKRRWLAEGEDIIALGAKATRELLTRVDCRPSDIDLVICSSTTPTASCPSMASRIVSTAFDQNLEVAAFDLNAACSGFLFGLQSAYDFLAQKTNGQVLLLTAEALSPMLDKSDFQTAPIFGDAATACLLQGHDFSGGESRTSIGPKLYRPVLSGRLDHQGDLRVPAFGQGNIQMRGHNVFRSAVRAMSDVLTRACKSSELRVSDLDLIVPHQANGRILDAIEKRTKVPIYRNLEFIGNTSSSSIPICLAEILDSQSAEESTRQPETLGLCAFGGGFTSGACLMEL